MQTTQDLICVTTKDTAVFWNANHRVCEAPLINDSEGRIGYLDGTKFQLLPKEFQPRLITK